MRSRHTARGSAGGVLVAALMLCALALATYPPAVRADAPDARVRKKLIETGWDHLNTRRLRENLALVEQQPFDGVVLVAEGERDDKKPCSLRPAFSGDKWEQRWFKSCVEDLKACRSKRLTDNFVSLGANPGNVDWFDDAGWKNVVEHWRIAAWVARQGQLKGILFDPEPYTKGFAQFSYAAQADREKHSFDEYYAKARERGREVMRAVAQEFPDLTLFCYFMNSVCSTATGHPDPRAVLAAHGYGLYPAFADGWMDVLPPAATVVDGCESAYRYNSTTEFLEAHLLMKNACQELVSPENRAKYRAQVQASYGIYLDAYWNPPTSPWYIDGKGGSRVERLRENVSTALRAADEYVWVYGEQFRWWPTPSGGVKKESWEEALPGSTGALRFARDPQEYGRARVAEMKQAGTLVDLTRNGDFASEKAAGNGAPAADWKAGGAPAGWGFWQESASQGTFTWDRETGAAGKGSARASQVSGGCFIQQTAAKPGERYAVQASRRIQGHGTASIRVRWQTPENKWTAEGLDRIFTVSGPADQWGEIFGVVSVPEGVGNLVILLGVSGQSTPQDVVWYDDVHLYKLD